KRVGQIPGVARLVRWHALAVQAAFPFRRFLDFNKTGLPEHFIEVAEIEGGAMLAVAKNEIRKSATERIEMARKRIVEPCALALAVSRDGAPEVGDDQANSAARP